VFNTCQALESTAVWISISGTFRSIDGGTLGIDAGISYNTFK